MRGAIAGRYGRWMMALGLLSACSSGPAPAPGAASANISVGGDAPAAPSVPADEGSAKKDALAAAPDAAVPPKFSPDAKSKTSPEPAPAEPVPAPPPPEVPADKGGLKSWLTATDQVFKNGERVYRLHVRAADGTEKPVGEWWPVKNGMNLLTHRSHPAIFADVGRARTYQEIFDEIGGVALAPDGLTTGSASFQLQGDTVVDGVRYSSPEKFPDYGIVRLIHGKREVEFTHKREVLAGGSGTDEDAKMEAFFAAEVAAKNTTFFLPSIKRGANAGKGSAPKVHRALVRRTTPTGAQIGLTIFDDVQSYDDTLRILGGLDRVGADGKTASETTHIFFTDGGPIWGQVARLTTDAAHPVARVETIGTADYTKLTNFIVLY